MYIFVYLMNSEIYCLQLLRKTEMSLKGKSFWLQLDDLGVSDDRSSITGANCFLFKFIIFYIRVIFYYNLTQLIHSSCLCYTFARLTVISWNISLGQRHSDWDVDAVVWFWQSCNVVIMYIIFYMYHIEYKKYIKPNLPY